MTQTAMDASADVAECLQKTENMIASASQKHMYNMV
jgi:hypothetical protein